MKKYITVVTVILLLILSHYLNILTPVEVFLSRLLAPAARTFYAAGAAISQAYGDQTGVRGLAEQLKQARADANRLTAENARLKFLEDENLALRRQLNFLDKNSVHYLMANVIYRGGLANSLNDSQSLLLDKGTADGLFAGLAVVSTDSIGTSSRGVIIGKIVSAKENISQVCLVTSQDCKLAVSILGENKTSGIARGELGLTVNMEFIPQTENIRIGDLVATSGLEQHISRGLVVGRVSKVIKENNEVWQSATIEPQINLDSPSLVAVLLP